MSTDPAIARDGTWTPWAAVLCLECEHAALKNSVRGKTYSKRLHALTTQDRKRNVAQPEGNLLGRCDTCECPCWTRYDVALLQQIGFRASDLDWEGPFGWELQQTGGMCAALVFETAGRQIVVTAMDNTLFVGEYPHVEGEEECWDSPLRMWESCALYNEDELKSGEELTAMLEECTRKVLAFIRQPLLTGEMITDEQIRTLMFDPSVDGVDHDICELALYPEEPVRTQARTRCAEILNARANGGAR